MKNAAFAALILAGSAAALGGKATTTRYYDGNKGACGCGKDNAFDWQSRIADGVYTAAASPAIFGNTTWCGTGCGLCFNLTSTGSAPCSDCGTGGADGESIVVMITNLCPHSGNEKWCPEAGNTNQYGYQYHFDIMTKTVLFGDNVVVDFESVTCPTEAVTDFAQCECA